MSSTYSWLNNSNPLSALITCHAMTAPVPTAQQQGRLLRNKEAPQHRLPLTWQQEHGSAIVTGPVAIIALNGAIEFYGLGATNHSRAQQSMASEVRSVISMKG